MSSDAINVEASARPVRVAYVLDPTTGMEERLEAAIRHSILVWGGSYSPIIPLIDAQIPAGWFDLLKACDPDVVYCLSSLPDNERIRILRECSPARIEDHNKDDRNTRFFLHQTALPSVSSKDILRFHQSRHFRFSGEEFVFVEDSRDSPYRPFYLHNFGISTNTFDWLRAYEDVPHKKVTADRDPADDTKGLLRLLSAIIPRDLGRLYSPSPRFWEHWGAIPTFQLVFGDSLIDAIYTWNWNVLTQGQYGRHILWIPRFLVENTAFLKEVGRWIARSFSGTSGFNGVLLSSEREEVELEAKAGELSALTHLRFRGARLHEVDYKFPAVSGSGRHFIVDAVPISRHQSSVAIINGRGLVSVPRPPFPLSPVQLERGCASLTWIMIWIRRDSRINETNGGSRVGGI